MSVIDRFLFEPCGGCEWCRRCAQEEQRPADAAWLGGPEPGSCRSRFLHVLAIAQTEDTDGPWLPPSVPSGYWSAWFRREELTTVPEPGLGVRPVPLQLVTAGGSR